MTEEEYIQKYVDSIKAYYPGAHVVTRESTTTDGYDTEVIVMLPDGSRKGMALVSSPDSPYQGAREELEEWDDPNFRDKLIEAGVGFDDPRYAGYTPPEEEPQDLQPLDQVAEETSGEPDDTDYGPLLDRALAQQRRIAEDKWFDEKPKYAKGQASAMPSYEVDYSRKPGYKMKIPEKDLWGNTLHPVGLTGHPEMDMTSLRNQRAGRSWLKLKEGELSPFHRTDPLRMGYDLHQRRLKKIQEDPSYKYPGNARALSERMTPTQVLPLMTEIKRDMYQDKLDNPDLFPDFRARLQAAESGEQPFEMTEEEKQQMDKTFQEKTEFERYDPEGFKKSRQKLEYLRDISMNEVPDLAEEYYA